MNPRILSLIILISVSGTHAMNRAQQDLLTPDTQNAQESHALIIANDALITVEPNPVTTMTAAKFEVDDSVATFFSHTPEPTRHTQRPERRTPHTNRQLDLRENTERYPAPLKMRRHSSADTSTCTLLSPTDELPFQQRLSTGDAEAQENLVRAIHDANFTRALGELQNLNTMVVEYRNVANQAKHARDTSMRAQLDNARKQYAQLGSAIHIIEQALRNDPSSCQATETASADDGEASDRETEEKYAAAERRETSGNLESEANHQQDDNAHASAPTTNARPDWNRIFNNFSQTTKVGLTIGCMTGGGAALTERLLTSSYCNLSQYDATLVCTHIEPLIRLCYHAIIYQNAEQYKIPYPELHIPAAWFGSWAMYLLLCNNRK